MNTCIGHDKNGEPLYEGDICKCYFIDEHHVKTQYEGIIIYDVADFQYVFEQLQYDFPLLWMGKAVAIEKIASLKSIDKNFPNYNKWEEIYKLHCKEPEMNNDQIYLKKVEEAISEGFIIRCSKCGSFKIEVDQGTFDEAGGYMCNFTDYICVDCGNKW
jgi:DNA-directed RNA polymerase subunit RPC12/RpoP